ncbi:MAG TPA: DinB family protein [Terriglobales bacterium]|nr:DinB family protein [Terriglobales bacterium]
MKSNAFLAALILAAGLWPAPARAQQAADKAAAKPPLTTYQAVLDQWNDVGRKLTAMAEDFPEDKYDFKPNPTQRSFAEQLLHASGVNYFFTNPVMGKTPPAEENPKREEFKTKADVAAYVKKAFADGAAALQAKGENGINDLVMDPFSHRQVKVSDFAYGFIEHSGEHYGQLVSYYRVAGLVPPESRPKK